MFLTGDEKVVFPKDFGPPSILTGFAIKGERKGWQSAFRSEDVGPAGGGRLTGVSSAGEA